MNRPGPAHTVELYVAVAVAAEETIASTAVTASWDEPSALDGYTIGGLAGHLARAILTVERYLDRPAPEFTTTDAAGYFAHVLADHDPVTSELHRSVRQRSVDESRDGPAALLARVRDARRSLEPRLAAAGDQPIAVLGDLVLPLGEYLQTRIVELVVHLDDLAVSVGRPGPVGIPPGAYDVVAAVLARVAVRRVGPLPTIRSLARAERHPDAVRAL